MRKIFTLIACLLSSNAFSADTPLFRNFPADIAPIDAGIPPDLSDRTAFLFRTRLRAAATGPINFAGRYKLTTWGCGTQCETGAAIDALTGQVIFLPFSVCCEDWPIDRDFKRILFRKDSRLIVLSGLLNETGENAVHFFEFANGQFRRVGMRIPPNSATALKAEQDHINDDRRRTAERAEAEARSEKAKQELAAAEADRKRAEIELQATKAKRIEDSEGVVRLAKDAFYACTDEQLSTLVKSGEPASVLAAAAINFCNTTFQNAARAMRDLDSLKSGVPTDEVVVSAALKEIVREVVTAQAVRVKAGTR